MREVSQPVLNPVRTVAPVIALLALALMPSEPGNCQNPQTSSRGREVYKDAQHHKRGYFGPGREEPDPQDLHAVLIGYFGPDDPSHPKGGTIWQGTTLAIDEANAEGGYNGLPFRLVTGWSENPWTGGVSEVVRMAYLKRVWAIIGSIDGSATHLAEQVVAKARVTLIDPASTDKSVNMANVAWMFSCMPADPAHAAVVGKALFDTGKRRSFALVSATDHDSRALAAEFKSFLAKSHASPKQHIEFASGVLESAAVAAQIVASGVDAVVVVAGPRDSARVVRDLRQRRQDLLVFGGPSMGRRVFLEEAGIAAEGVRFPLVAEDSDTCRRFSEKFRERYGFTPDYAAAHANDATRLLIAAIRKAGLNRVRIRDAVEELSPWHGVAGVIRWNTVGRNSRVVRLGTIREGRVEQASSALVLPGS